MKKIKRMNGHTHKTTKNKERVPFIEKIIGILKTNLFWCIIGTIVAMIALSLTITTYVKTQKRKVSVSIGDFEIKNGELVNIYYLLPAENIRCGEKSGILPIELIKKRGSNTENFILHIEARPYLKKKTIYVSDENGELHPEEKIIAIDTKLRSNTDNKLAHLLPEYICREYFKCDSVLNQERIFYHIGQLNPQTKTRLYEEFSVDTTRVRMPDNHYTPVEDFFTLNLNCSYKDMEEGLDCSVNLWILNFSSLEEIAADCKATGTLTWGRITRLPAPKSILNLIICPGYEIGSMAKQAFSLNTTKIYSFEHDLETLFHKRRLVIKDNSGNIFKKYEFDDSAEKRAFFKKNYDSYDKKITTKELQRRQSAPRS